MLGILYYSFVTVVVVLPVVVLLFTYRLAFFVHLRQMFNLIIQAESVSEYFCWEIYNYLCCCFFTNKEIIILAYQHFFLILHVIFIICI